jgi:hypothetical protein
MDLGRLVDIGPDPGVKIIGHNEEEVRLTDDSKRQATKAKQYWYY